MVSAVKAITRREGQKKGNAKKSKKLKEITTLNKIMQFKIECT